MKAQFVLRYEIQVGLFCKKFGNAYTFKKYSVKIESIRVKKSNVSQDIFKNVHIM